MYISLNWISDFVDLKGINLKELSNRFTLSTAELDDVVEKGKDIRDVVVGKAIKVENHPESKKLHIVQVDIGNKIIQSVCGAPNVREGILVPTALIGGSVKGIEKIERAKVAGVESQCVLCSAMELGISDDHSGLLVLDENLKLGTDIKDIIEIDDVLFDIDNKALTNRPDLWGHYGIAREIAALSGRKLKPLDVDQLIGNDALSKLDISVEDKEKCFRYSGISIDNINVKTSPINMQTRLYYCGMRPISLLVDLTNYLMLEVGQPMHAFDKRFIEKIEVKSTKGKTKFVTLDGIERNIHEDVLMICNQDGPVALAGIMGGANSEVGDDTTAIVLESAAFEGISTRKNAARIGVRTEASARYEKMIDPELTVPAIKRFVKLLKGIDGGVKLSSALTDVYNKKYDGITIKIDKAYIDKYLGFSLPRERIVQILEALEFGVQITGDIFTVEVPSFRATKDITIKADLIEEISRIYGYDNIEPDTTNIVLEPLEYNMNRLQEHKVKELLAEAHGLNEVQSYIWYDNKANARIGIDPREGLHIVNAVAEGIDVLRDSIVPMHLNFTVTNNKHYDKFEIFEIGSVFSIKDKKKNCEEHKNLCVLLASKSETEDQLFYKAKGILNSLFMSIKKVVPEYKNAKHSLEYPWVHPIKSAEVLYDNDELGYICAVHPKIKENIDRKLNIVIVEINMFKYYDIKEKIINYSEPSKYQQVKFDLSLLVDKGTSFEKVNGDISKYKNVLLKEYKFIDLYEGKGLEEGKKSMTFGFTIGANDHTLTGEEIDGLRNDLIKYAEKHGYSLR